jgi:hypothetical protein
VLLSTVQSENEDLVFHKLTRDRRKKGIYKNKMLSQSSFFPCEVTVLEHLSTHSGFDNLTSASFRATDGFLCFLVRHVPEIGDWSTDMVSMREETTSVSERAKIEDDG